MSRFRKTLMIVVLSAALAFMPTRSNAFVQIVAIWLLEVTGGSILITDALAGVTGVLATVLWYDCNKLSASPVCDSKSPQPASGAPTPMLTVDLRPDAKRSNPDPAAWEYLTDKSRDVSPKKSVPPNSKVTSTLQPGAAVWKYGSLYFANSSEYLNSRPVSAFNACTVVTPDRRYSCQWEKAKDAGGGNVVFYRVMRYLTCLTQYCTPADPEPIYSLSFTAVIYDGPTCKGIYDSSTSTCSGLVRCPSGYTSVDKNSCTLSDMSQVKKPADTPCEVQYDSNAKSFRSDSMNTNCDSISTSITTTSSGQPSFNQPSGTNSAPSISVTGNADGGFTVNSTFTDGHGSTLTTGPYDPHLGGYPIVSTGGQTPDGQGDGCGIAGKPACAVSLPMDNATLQAVADARDAVKSGDSLLKGQLDAIPADKFSWTFIPQIPTAQCVNPQVKNPANSNWLAVDICGGFNKFSFMLNAVLAVLCVYGCVRQIQAAMKA